MTYLDLGSIKLVPPNVCTLQKKAAIEFNRLILHFYMTPVKHITYSHGRTTAEYPEWIRLKLHNKVVKKTILHKLRQLPDRTNQLILLPRDMDSLFKRVMSRDLIRL